jgi:hypothetical protein
MTDAPGHSAIDLTMVTVWKKTRHKRFPQKAEKLADMRVIHLFHVESVKIFPIEPINC